MCVRKCVCICVCVSEHECERICTELLQGRDWWADIIIEDCKWTRTKSSNSFIFARTLLYNIIYASVHMSLRVCCMVSITNLMKILHYGIHMRRLCAKEWKNLVNFIGRCMSENFLCTHWVLSSLRQMPNGFY